MFDAKNARTPVLERSPALATSAGERRYKRGKFHCEHAALTSGR
ncbi:hypothetical protein [Caballeronia sordidicola]|uniref:Uncharacterized protein n=1 Tax=Caballeronia sordidicola TaxID=196367 RepID=A0A242N0R9_CABSO|nr:hypothetical protein [Caballeronia sordidicola]OTP77280.1 hypothetical protein PAMC26577_08460 [Caballeronia sordidicola]